MRLINSEVRFLRHAAGATVERGYEQQRYLFHDDGTLSLSALSFATDRGLVREVVLNLDAAHRPLDCYVHIHHRDRVEGTGWFRFGENGVTADLWNVRTGHARDSAATLGPVKAFVAHPIASDVMLAAAFDRHSHDRVQELRDVFMSSSDHFGAVGPEIARVALDMEYVGVETREAAGRSFETDHWRILPGNDRTGHTHPGEDLWSIRDTFIFVHAEIAAIGYEYRLVSFHETHLT
jgi:hypothetical protein